MKKRITLSAIAVGAISLAFAQNPNHKSFNDKSESMGAVKYAPPTRITSTAPEAVYFSEDFSNGIPSNWSNEGYDYSMNPVAAAVFEYRGTNTNPDVNTGSRDSYSVGSNDGGPLQSPTANNGFVIFDSGYLDNAGISGNDQNGPAPSPHVGTLTTDTLDLTGASHLELKFNSHNKFWGYKLFVAFSTDGGLTYPDSIEIQKGLSQALMTDPRSVVRINVSSQIGNKSNVRIRFVFDGRYDGTGVMNPSGFSSGYYFWMLDDIELRTLPKYAINVIDDHGRPILNYQYDSDITTPGGTRFVENTGTNQTRSIGFGTIAENHGWGTLNNAKLKVDYLDNNNTLLKTEYSSSVSSVAPGAIIPITSLNNYGNGYTFSTVGQYKVAIQVVSDSASTIIDTLHYEVSNNALSSDFNNPTNDMGSHMLGNDDCALATLIDMKQPGVLEKVRVYLDQRTVVGGEIQIEVCDSAGFSYTGGFPNILGGSSKEVITTSDMAQGYKDFNVGGLINPYIELNAQGYFLVARMFSSADANRVRILNDASMATLGYTSMMYDANDGRWYTGYTDSRRLNIAMIQGLFSTYGVSIDENEIAHNVKTFWSSRSESIHIKAAELKGTHTLTVFNLNGQLLSTYQNDFTQNPEFEIPSHHLSNGVYLITIDNNQNLASFKVNVIR
jgi:hypothetical protein